MPTSKSSLRADPSTMMVKPPFQVVNQGKETDQRTVPATLSDFKIEPLSLLTIRVKNEIPVRVDLTWRDE